MSEEAEIPVPEQTPAEPGAPKRRRLRLALKQEEVEIEDANGVVKTYTAREVLSDVLALFRNRADAKLKRGPNGTIESIDSRGTHADLISLCLYDDRGRQVPAKVIEKWPASTVLALFDLCADLNAQTPDSADREKKA